MHSTVWSPVKDNAANVFLLLRIYNKLVKQHGSDAAAAREAVPQI